MLQSAPVALLLLAASFRLSHRPAPNDLPGCVSLGLLWDLPGTPGHKAKPAQRKKKASAPLPTVRAILPRCTDGWCNETTGTANSREQRPCRGDALQKVDGIPLRCDAARGGRVSNRCLTLLRGLGLVRAAKRKPIRMDLARRDTRRTRGGGRAKSARVGGSDGADILAMRLLAAGEASSGCTRQTLPVINPASCARA